MVPALAALILRFSDLSRVHLFDKCIDILTKDVGMSNTAAAQHERPCRELFSEARPFVLKELGRFPDDAGARNRAWIGALLRVFNFTASPCLAGMIATISEATAIAYLQGADASSFTYSTHVFGGVSL